MTIRAYTIPHYSEIERALWILSSVFPYSQPEKAGVEIRWRSPIASKPRDQGTIYNIYGRNYSFENED